jgi:hypothetical protein
MKESETRSIQLTECFEEIFNSISTTISFDEKWRWGMSLRGAIHDLKHRLVLKNGESAKCVDDLNRKVVFLGTPLGIIVMYASAPLRGAVRVTYVVPEVFCEKELFLRSSSSLNLWSLQNIISLEFAQVMQEIAFELETV